MLLQHGLLDSATTWVLNNKTASLAFMLADKGFDVWMGNNRGNTYSPCQNDACWAFTYDEMAVYDLPTFINFVLNTTGHKTLSYVGHSEGTTQAFAGFSFDPKLGEKVNLFVALSPVVYVNHQKSPLVNWLVKLDAAQIFALFGLKSFLPSSWILKDIAKLFCDGGIFTDVCEDVIFALCGTDPEKDHNLDKDRLADYLTHTPAGTSVQNMVHWAQAVSANDFQMYDFGKDENEKKYGQPTPPLYNLTAFNVSVAFFSGGDDYLGDPEDVLRLAGLLPERLLVFNNFQEDYEHLDFVWGMDAYVKIYGDVINLISAVENDRFNPVLFEQLRNTGGRVDHEEMAIA